MKQFYLPIRLNLYLIAIFILSFNVMKSQPWQENLNNNQKKNFFEVQKSFEYYWKGKDVTQKGIGWKQFKRWEWFWEQRVYPNGELPNPMQTYNEKLNSTIKKQKKDNIQTVGVWSFLGPETSTGGYGGLGRVNCIREHPNYSNVLFAGSSGGGLWMTTNNGVTWTPKTDNIQSMGVTDLVIDPTNSNVIYIATGDGDAGDTYSVGVLKSTDAGTTWNLTGLNWDVSQGRTINRLLMHPNNPDIIYAGCSNGIYKTINGGTTWSQIYTSSVKDMEFKPGTPSTIYASKTTIIRSTDEGTTWSQLTNGLPTSGVQRIALAVTPADPNYVYALMSGANSGFFGLYQSVSGGDSWTLMSTTPNILGWNTSGSDAGGQGWYDLGFAVSQTSANEIYSGGINVWKSTNGGINWTCMTNWTSTAHADQHDLWFAPGTNRLYAGNDGGVYKTTNNGTNWSWIGSGLSITQFYKLGCSVTNPNLVIAGAQDNGTKFKGNTSWSDVIGGDGMEACIDHTNSNIMYGELYYGQILKSTNSGVSFNYMSLPTEFSQGYGAWVTPFVMHPTNSSILYVGYKNVHKTTDGGASWTKISSFTSGSLNVLHVAPSNPDYIYASTGTSSLQRTSNGGTTWTALALPCTKAMTYIAISQNDPLKIWASFSGYTVGQKVYFSTDGGTNWTNISGTLPNVPVNCVVYQKDFFNRIYIGTDIGVYYKDDNTPDWVDFSTNLPNVVISELEIQYSSGKMRAATFGRGLWEAEIPTTVVTLPTPVLATPLNNAIDVTINPNLTWNPVTNATGYILQYSNYSDFSSITQTTATNTNININGLYFNSNYYWRVKATNGNNTSEWSPSNHFTTINLVLDAPTLSTPANNSTGVVINPALTWNSVTNATGYVVQYSPDSNFGTLTEVALTGTSTNIEGLSYLAPYYWRVKATNNNISSNWSSIFNFTTINMVLDLPVLVSPSNSATGVSINPVLTWNTVVNATGYILRYSKDINFTTSTEISLSATSYSLTGLANTTKYYWQVRATNGNILSNWSSSFSFTTTSTILSAPDLSSPVNNSTNVALIKSLSWKSVTNAKGYILQYSKESDFSTYTEVKSTSTSYRLSGLDYWTTYYWRVKAYSGNLTGNWSTKWNFVTLSSKLSKPALISPESSVKNVSKSPTFVWTSVQNAIDYKLQYSTDFFFGTYQELSSDDTTVSASGLTKNTVYYWRVQSVNGSITSDWTAARCLKTVNSDGKYGEGEEYSNNNSISLDNISLDCYPNPFSNSANIDIYMPYDDVIEVAVYSMLGEKLLPITTGRYKIGKYSFNIKNDNMASGIYMLVLKSGNNVITKSIIINK
jgi:photosystem II stability/assembly factor-like uncharacterized protein